jgi:hypothetical protein
LSSVTGTLTGDGKPLHVEIWLSAEYFVTMSEDACFLKVEFRFPPGSLRSEPSMRQAARRKRAALPSRILRIAACLNPDEVVIRRMRDCLGQSLGEGARGTNVDLLAPPHAIRGIFRFWIQFLHIVGQMLVQSLRPDLYGSCRARQRSMVFPRLTACIGLLLLYPSTALRGLSFWSPAFRLR